MKTEKQKQDELIQLAEQIATQIGDMFQEDSENFIDLETVDLTLFIHALATMAPAAIYEQLTGEKTDYLRFNQLCNTLCFQFIKSVK